MSHATVFCGSEFWVRISMNVLTISTRYAAVNKDVNMEAVVIILAAYEKTNRELPEGSRL